MTVDVGPVGDFEDRRFRIVKAGGNEVVKMKPLPQERTKSTVAAVEAM